MADARARALAGASRWLDLVFLASGFALASWGSRVPDITAAAHLGAEGFAAALLVMAVAMVATTVLAPHLVQRIGAGRAIQAGAILVTLSLATLGVEKSLPWLVVVALFLIGIGMGICDLAINVAGTMVDLDSGVPRMPRLHGMFSLGTVLGASGGLVTVWLGVSVAWHIPVAALCFGLLAWFCGHRLAAQLPLLRRPPAPGQPPSGLRQEWTNRRTVAIGVVLLGMAFAEDTANDWLALFLVRGYEKPHAVGAAGLAIFVAAMTVIRFAYSWLASRPGRRVRPLRRRYDLLLMASGLVVVAGTLLLLLGSVLPDRSQPAGLVLAVVGIALWGSGAALGFPLAVTAAADAEGAAHLAGRASEVGPGSPGPVPFDRATASVSVVTTMGYAAALGGPPVIGWVAERLNYVSALAVVPLVVLTTLAVGAALHPRAVATRDLDLDGPAVPIAPGRPSLEPSVDGRE